ncbi:MAG: flagellar hook-length control protein FliK [Syntrophaceae bacterium]
MPSNVHFPPVFKPLVDPVVQIKLAQPPSTGLSVGQTLEARVLEKLEDGRFIIRIGSSHITAEAEPTLQPGQAMTLRVDSLSPRVLLSVAPPTEGRVTAEHLRIFRSNPGALTQSLAELAEIAAGMRGADFSRLAGRDNLAALLDALASAMLGREQIERGFSLRDAVRSLGLRLEGDLKKALESPGVPSASLKESLKPSLMKLIDELRARLQSVDTPPADAKTIRELTPVLERTVRAIENQQVLNVHFQETEGKLLIQVPLILPGLAGKADIFVRDEDWRPGRGGRKESFRVVFALEMDALGDVMAQAHVHGKAVSCRIRCENEDVAAFVTGLFPGLEEQLRQIGCTAVDLSASAVGNVREAMEEFLREELYGDGQTLNLFA